MTNGEQHSGRLELTWTNKDKRLLSDEEGNYGVLGEEPFDLQ